jgi:hypothetical protein
MAKRFGKALLIVLIILILGWTFIVTFDSDTVPDVSFVRTHPRLQAFLQNPTDIEGIYKNTDVGSCVFSYRTGLSEADFWCRVDEAANAEGWLLSKDEADTRIYERVSKTGQGSWWGGEQASVAILSGAHSVVVAWVQGDSSSKIDRFSDLRESEWASRVLQPKFEETVSSRESGTGRPPGPFHGIWEEQGELIYIITDLPGKPVNVSAPENDTWEIEIKDLKRDGELLRFQQLHFTEPDPKLKTLTNPTVAHAFSGIPCDVVLSLVPDKPDVLNMSMESEHTPKPILGLLQRRQYKTPQTQPCASATNVSIAQSESHVVND